MDIFRTLRCHLESWTNILRRLLRLLRRDLWVSVETLLHAATQTLAIITTELESEWSRVLEDGPSINNRRSTCGTWSNYSLGIIVCTSYICRFFACCLFLVINSVDNNNHQPN